DSILSFCYPPLSILLALPGYYLAGDVRWSLLAATGLAATLLVAAGRRLGLPAGHRGELGAALLLFHPLTPIVVSRGWTEPFVVADPALFWLGNVTHHLVSPPRPDSLSLSAAIRSATGHYPSPAWGLAAAAAVTWAVVRRRPAPLSRAALGGGAVFLTFFLLN